MAKTREATTDERVLIRDIVMRFADVEMELRKELDGKYRVDQVSEFINMALVNYVGNFIYQNSGSDQQRIKNYKAFLSNFNTWIQGAEQHATKN